MHHGRRRGRILGAQDLKRRSIPLPSKVNTIKNFPTPTTIKQLQEFHGMVTFYRRYFPGIAEVLTPLNNLLKGKPKKLEWTTTADVAFATAASLAYPDQEGELQLYTDASNNATGAVLQQQTAGKSKPLAFFSKKLLNTQRRYAAFDRELLAVVLAVGHFKHLLEGKEFRISTEIICRWSTPSPRKQTQNQQGSSDIWQSSQSSTVQSTTYLGKAT